MLEGLEVQFSGQVHVHLHGLIDASDKLFLVLKRLLYELQNRVLAEVHKPIEDSQRGLNRENIAEQCHDRGAHLDFKNDASLAQNRISFLLFSFEPLLDLSSDAQNFGQVIVVSHPPVQLKHNFRQKAKSDHLVLSSGKDQTHDKIHSLCVADLLIELSVCTQNVVNRV